MTGIETIKTILRVDCGVRLTPNQAIHTADYIEQLEQENSQLKGENTLMKLFLEDLVKWNSHGYVGAKEILDKLRQKAQEDPK